MRVNAILHLYSWGVTFGWGSSRVPMMRPQSSPSQTGGLSPGSSRTKRDTAQPSMMSVRTYMEVLDDQNKQLQPCFLGTFLRIHCIGYIGIDVSTALGSPQSLNTMGQLVFFQICNKNDIPSWCPVGWTPQWISWQSHPKDHLPNPS